LSASTNAKERLDVSFRSESPIVCTVSGSTVTTVAVGRCDITAYQGGSATYAAAQGSGSFQATTPEVRSAQQIVFGPVPGTTVGVPVVLTASSRSLAYQRADSATGLAVSYTSQNRRVCTVSGATLTLTAAGTCTVTASQPGDAQYAPADSMTGSFPVGKIPQTISFSLPGSATVGRPVILTATASSGLAVNYTSGSTDVCTVSGSTLTLAKAGTCTVTASQPGDDKYLPARPETRSFPVQKIPQTIDFRPPQDVAFGRPVRLIATASSGLPVSYSTDTPDVCRVSGRTVTTRAARACAVTASQVGDDRYAPARDAARSFRVERAAQIITFTPPDGMTLGQPVTLSASASSGLDVSYHADTPAVCTVSGSSVSPATVGTCAITASQPGNDDYAPAAGESRSFPVHPASGDRIRKNSQAIAFAQPSPAAVAQMVPLSASATSGLAVSFRSDTPSVCTVSGNTVTAITAGTCAVTASQTGDDHFAAARDMQRSFAVHVGQAPGNKGRGKASQTIFFGQPQAAAVGQVVPLTASASSGLAVSFQSDTPAVCSVSGATVTTTTAGTCTVTGSQAGSPGASITRIKEGKS
jgi:hypothetical protein